MKVSHCLVVISVIFLPWAGSEERVTNHYSSPSSYLWLAVRAWSMEDSIVFSDQIGDHRARMDVARAALTAAQAKTVCQEIDRRVESIMRSEELIARLSSIDGITPDQERILKDLKEQHAGSKKMQQRLLLEKELILRTARANKTLETNRLPLGS